MKIWGTKSISVVVLAMVAGACAPGEETLNKRQSKLVDLAKIDSGNVEPGSGNGNAEPGTPKSGAEPEPTDPVGGSPSTSPGPTTPVAAVIPERTYPALKLTAVTGLESIRAEDALGIELISKVSATDFVLFGKAGKSWSYRPAAPAAETLKVIEPIVVPPAGAILYSLPNSQFWFVSPDKLGRHKPAAGDDGDNSGSGSTGTPKTITVEQFSTASFLGDRTKMKVLYVSVDEVIFHLSTHIAILNVKTSPAQIKQLPIDKLPVDLKGEVQAGRTDNGYWFKANGNLFLLASKEVEGASPWSKGTLAADPASLPVLAMWMDDAAGTFSGVTLGISAKAILSSAGRP